MTTAYKNIKNKQGFTLIELLIVMAILGVLAVVVLVAINPVQQLARTRDAGRFSSVSQIGHAVEAYMASHNGTYPPDLDELVTSGELTNVPSQVNNSLGATPDCSTGVVNGWCYVADTDSFAVWTPLEADSNVQQGACGGSAYASYLSLAGKTCITCGEPNADSQDDFCEN